MSGSPRLHRKRKQCPSCASSFIAFCFLSVDSVSPAASSFCCYAIPIMTVLIIELQSQKKPFLLSAASVSYFVSTTSKVNNNKRSDLVSTAAFFHHIPYMPIFGQHINLMAIFTGECTKFNS